MKSLLLFVLLFSFSELFPQSFTWNGPTSKTIGYGSSSTNCSYTFSYQNINGLVNPTLVIAVDGSVISVDLCNAGNGGWRPSSYTITLTEGTHTIKFSLLSVDPDYLDCYYPIVHQVQQFNINILFCVRVQNNFTKPDGSGGIIHVNDLFVDKIAPYDRPSLASNYFQIGAIEQSDGVYNRIWNTSGTNNSEWDRQLYNLNPTLYSYIQNTTYTVLTNDRNTSLIAGLRKVCNINFQNNFIGVGNGGTIIVNGTQYNSPTSGITVIEQNPITATAQNQTINGIDYTFTSWSDGSTQNPRTFYPGDNITYTANFSGKPNTANRYQHYSSSNPNLPITVLWSEHPSMGVTQYQIWRKVNYKKQGVGSPSLIGTVNRGTLNFVDNDYAGTRFGYTDYMLWYDVKPYYSTEGTVSVDNYASVFSDGLLAKGVAQNKWNSNEIVTENKMENYPNPFNPSTMISYQIVNPGLVSIKVYNCLGKEIANLVSEEQNSGSYKVMFNAGSLSSGIYFYRIVANGYSETKKMILTK
jgi:hypothetical protein